MGIVEDFSPTGNLITISMQPGSKAQLVAYVTAGRGLKFEPQLSHITSLEIDHE